MPRRPDLKVILMSATLNVDILRNYFYPVIEVNIPGRTYPVQEFFLEDVLSMTKFVENTSGGNEEQLEADLLSAFGSAAATAGSLKCPMCGNPGFSTPEELGAHVAVCDGGGGDYGAIEDKLRSGELAPAPPKPQKPAAAAAGGEDEFDDYEEYEDYDEDEPADADSDADGEFGEASGVAKWDGTSTFGGDLLKQSTLTETELLGRYQTMFDDEEIDYDLLLATMTYINKSSLGSGGILVFFPGWREISEMTMTLESTPPFDNANNFRILQLHSGIPAKDQRKVFQSCPPGCRKIVLATNIAETSITIDDIAFVIDTGKAKEKSCVPRERSEREEEEVRERREGARAKRAR
ncbi:hypothetical protein TeGR_g7796 [Tetraparma gracilis]|uniref:Helicase C-terminal domain-containing protein n=1 Tax=Tetraparma gracilis TaxID=2962635 RepID=A0ABQ6MN96_9STRA|nr:hypothetical protein TeGR_g7796 [Tetraparma gracilis]